MKFILISALLVGALAGKITPCSMQNYAVPSCCFTDAQGHKPSACIECTEKVKDGKALKKFCKARGREPRCCANPVTGNNCVVPN
ncbi:hypothetical protein K461DRAFT_298151 [Myriangium duriaei CBS 260.36]|uniref:Uncharacterized protein n=1 Tax=Myriangium duriaei CBS 260.36 TaxID=1168546 RepID=A0A9P4IUG2_9PEZI|nr:hypothetical protein K461DRAFT_298151 [Myriangium duriaei CBS 260.36]